MKCLSGNMQNDEFSTSSGEGELPQEPIISHAREGGSIPKIERQMTILLLSFAYGGFVFMCLMHMGTWEMDEGPLSFILALWNMTPLAVFAIIPERLTTSRVFTVIHMISFLAILTFLTWMAYDLTYVHIDGLNAIAFMTMPIITFIFVAVFYSLSLLVSYLKFKTSRQRVY